MIYRGRVWLSIGRWARLHGMSSETAKRHLQISGIYAGRRVHLCPVSGDRIRRIRGYDVLLRRVNGHDWAYLPRDDAPQPDMTEDDDSLKSAMNSPHARTAAFIRALNPNVS